MNTTFVRGALVLVTLGALGRFQATAQTPQYVSPSGAVYLSLTDSGPVARAESALAAEPGSVSRLLALGLARSAVRQYREAIATFTRAIAIAPDSAILYRWRGHRYLSVRQLDSARADLEHGLALDSLLYGCWYHLGIVRYVTGDFAEAATAFAHARQLAPDSSERAGSIDWLWMSLSRAGRSDEARALLAGNLDSLPRNHVYTRRLALYRGLIAPDLVVTAADTDDITLATLSYGIGNWHLVQGDTARARRWFERSVASGGWPAFGFIAAEAELRRLR